MSPRESFTTDEARQAGAEIGIDWERAPFDVEQFRRGMGVELEHGLHDSTTNVTGDDPIFTAKIALAHLNEFPDYYVRLEHMEHEAKSGIAPASTLADEFLPVFDVSDEVAVTVHSDIRRAWASLMDADLIELGRRRPLIGLLGAARMLPDLAWSLLHGERPPAAPDRLTLRGIAELPMKSGGWVLLAERPPEGIALGLVGKFWRPVIEFGEVTADAFTSFAEPGFAKTVYALGTRRLGDEQTLLWANMRTYATDEHARTWFRRYWTLGVGAGAHVLAHGLLDSVREDAERAPG